jgi:hypothetical protein
LSARSPRDARRTVPRRLAQIIGATLFLVAAVTLVTSFTAANTVAPSRAGVSTEPLAPGEFPPTSTITFPVAAATYGGATWSAGCAAAVCGTARDSAGGSNVQSVRVSILGPGGHYWNGTDFGASTGEQRLLATGTTSWSLAFPIANFATPGGGDGTYTVKAYATDSSGNVQAPAATATATIDMTAPTTP